MMNKEVAIAELCTPISDFQGLEKISDNDMVDILEELKQMWIRKNKMKIMMDTLKQK